MKNNKRNIKSIINQIPYKKLDNSTCVVHGRSYNNEVKFKPIGMCNKSDYIFKIN